MIDIVPEQPDDAAEIETLLDAAFGADRIKKTSYSFRRGVECLPSLCLVTRREGRLVGTIRAWPIAVAGTDIRALLLGPVAVAASERGDGLGSRLIETMLDRARTEGFKLAVLVGDLTYYGRFGFDPASLSGLVMPNEKPERVLSLSLRDAPVAGGELVPWQRSGPARPAH